MYICYVVNVSQECFIPLKIGRMLFFVFQSRMDSHEGVFLKSFAYRICVDMKSLPVDCKGLKTNNFIMNTPWFYTDVEEYNGKSLKQFIHVNYYFAYIFLVLCCIILIHIWLYFLSIYFPSGVLFILCFIYLLLF